jgi:hypothetical protein
VREREREREREKVGGREETECMHLYPFFLELHWNK